ncbi:MAG: Kelch repeat-containing protein [Candidatus Dormibacteria bacterium]
MANPISRELVLPGPGAAQLTILGGLTAGGSSASGVYTLNTTGGGLSRTGSLVGPLHDASGAIVGGHATVFGGGTVSSTATVQALQPGLGAAAAVGNLPQARSDSAATSIGQTAYVVGGYDGSNFDATVLATSNGTSFQQVATLPVPVRYPGVAAVNGLIYVFGGQTANGLAASQIQVIDPKTHTARVVGNMPEPDTGSVAVTLGGTIYVAGGNTSAATGTAPVSVIWAFNPVTDALLVAGQLRVPVAHAGAAVLGPRAWIVGGETARGSTASVQMLTPNLKFGIAGQAGAGSPFFGGDLLIADSGSNKLLLLNPSGQIIWTYPGPGRPAPPGGFYYPDDAFFADHGTAITINMESYQEIVKIAYPSGKVLWTYGHPGVPGSAPGYLHTPDDAYQLKTGQISVADIGNCRVLILNPNGTIARQIGTPGVCQHQPPRYLGSPNGDTPVPGGGLLVSEINGSWISEFSSTGALKWTTHLDLAYPSDPQRLGPNRYLIAGYTRPGQIVEFNRQGTITYRYQVASGPGALNHPSLVEMLPSGVFMLNDDHNDRMIAIDPATKAAVWQYGVQGVPGNAPGLLHDPDGFDLLMPGGSTPTHSASG